MASVKKVTEPTHKIDGEGLVLGQMELRHGVLCSVDERGRLYLRAPRRSDVQLAQRVVASLAKDPLASLAADITSIRERRA